MNHKNNAHPTESIPSAKGHLRPKVGIGVIIIKDNQILLGKRQNAHGAGYWAPPGGHLEFGESFEECAKREVLEETGLYIKNVIQGPITNDIFLGENKHYITIFMIAQYTQGEPQLLEPDKCEGWYWCDINNLPNPLFLSFDNLLKQGFSF